MGRRSLPTIDPAVSLQDHLLVLQDLPETLDPQTLFARRQPLEIEIGSGKGLFLATHSAHHPERNFLVLKSRESTRYSAYRLAKQEQPNAAVIVGDGLALFHQFLPDRCAIGVHVYFPDPWWKERHRRRRIMKPAFIADVQRVLVSGGHLHFWTDVAQYYEETLRLIQDDSELQGPIAVPETAALHDMDFRTHFERRMRLNEHDVFRAQFVKP